MPQNIRYPQDINLLYETRENLNLAKCKKLTSKKSRKAINPERALADKIYRNHDNLAYCKLHGIRLSEPRLERPKKDAVVDKKRNTMTLLTA